jgi:hypothetical protein
LADCSEIADSENMSEIQFAFEGWNCDEVASLFDRESPDDSASQADAE